MIRSRGNTHTAAWLFIVPFIAACAGGAAWADVVELAGGGQIEGKVLDDAGTDSTLVIETAAGGRIALPRSQVSRVVESSDVVSEYQRLARSAPDTVEDHWRLAEWCREHELDDQSQSHLERILELDPDHAQARRLLGYREVGGAWMTRDEVMAARGLVKYNGKYHTRQHIELLEREEQTRASATDWSNRLDRWRRWLTSRRQDRAEQAREEIAAIRDPSAAVPLVKMLRREEHYELKRLWIEVATRLDHPLAVEALVEFSLYDPDEIIRAECLEHLVDSGRPGLVTPYIRALRSKDNAIVNRAAAALGQLGDTDAISPLIDALITKHRFQVGGSGDQHAYSFSPQGGSFSFGGGAKVVTQTVKNPSVLSALVVLSGGTSFDYDQQQWRAWLAAQAKFHPVNVRRDE